MEKKSFWALIGSMLIIGSVLAGCGGTPSAVVKKAYAADEKGDAKTVALLLSSSNGVGRMASQISRKGVIVKTTELVYGGGTAKVTVTHKNGDSTIVSLKKIDGKWKISGFEELQLLYEYDGRL